MFKIIACNKANCHLTVLQPYTKIRNLPTNHNNRRPTKPMRLNLTEPLYIDMANNIPKTPQPTNVTIQQLFNRSCVPIDSELSNGTKLDKGYSSLPTSQVGDCQRNSGLDRRQSQPEIEGRPTLQKISEAHGTTERLSTCETGSGQSHTNSTQNSGNSI